MQDIKRLTNKPVTELGQCLTIEDRDQFLLITKAVKEQLLTVKISLPDDRLQVPALWRHIPRGEFATDLDLGASR